MSIPQELVQYIISASLATEISKDIFLEDMPTDPDQAIAVTEYPGSTTASEAVSRNFQLLVRDINHELSSARAHALFLLLDKPTNPIHYVSPTVWWIGRAKQPPFKLKVDEQKRVYYAFNLQIITPVI